MAASVGPVDVSKELAALKHEKKNQSMRRLPSDTTINRRPLNHAPIASPYAGAHVQKVVYVSRKTPIMSAVKRVKKLLQHVEKRAMQGVDMKRQNDTQIMAELAQVSERLKKTSEEVLVKASGRAMEQALRVGEWFKTREDEMRCKVEVRTGSVAAIDDIVEVENNDEADEEVLGHRTVTEETTLEGGDTTLELLGNQARNTVESSGAQPDGPKEGEALPEGVKASNNTRKRRRKRKRVPYDEEEIPEARIRWVKTVEVAISLRA